MVQKSRKPVVSHHFCRCEVLSPLRCFLSSVARKNVSQFKLVIHPHIFQFAPLIVSCTNTCAEKTWTFRLIRGPNFCWPHAQYLRGIIGYRISSVSMRCENQHSTIGQSSA